MISVEKTVKGWNWIRFEGGRRSTREVNEVRGVKVGSNYSMQVTLQLRLSEPNRLGFIDVHIALIHMYQ